MYYSTIDKLVLSDHLYQMHSLLAEFLQTLWNINNLIEMREEQCNISGIQIDYLQTDTIVSLIVFPKLAGQLRRA